MKSIDIASVTMNNAITGLTSLVLNFVTSESFRLFIVDLFT